jgi:glycosyltransferase involved in cell wall biosynthesis
MADISVVVPTLNSGWSLRDTLYSILNQEGVVARIIVVDSGSQDDTLQICEDFGVDVVYEEPGNMYRAINIGLRMCDTPWLAYTNSDDMWYLDALHRLIDYGEATESNLVYGVCDYIDRYGRFLHSLAPPKPHYLASFYRLRQQPFAQQTAIFKRSLFHSMGGFDEEFRFAADFDFFLRAYVRGSRFDFLRGAPVARFRLHGKQLGRRESAMMKEEGFRSRTRMGLKPQPRDHLVRLQWRIRNFGNYIVRSLRRSQLEGKLAMPDSMKGFHLDRLSRK